MSNNVEQHWGTHLRDPFHSSSSRPCYFTSFPFLVVLSSRGFHASSRFPARSCFRSLAALALSRKGPQWYVPRLPLGAWRLATWDTVGVLAHLRVLEMDWLAPR